MTMSSVNLTNLILLLISGFLINSIVEGKGKNQCKLVQGSNNIFVCNATIGSFHLTDVTLKDSLSYVWNIQPNNTNGTIGLFFEDLFLDEGDKVTLYTTMNDTQNSSLSIIKPILAQNGTLTLLTNLTELVVKYEGKSSSLQREFQVSYSASPTWSFAINPEVTCIDSPIYIGNEKSVKCEYTYAHDPHKREIPVFRFDSFNFNDSQVNLDGTSYPSATYRKDLHMEFFPAPRATVVKIDVVLNNFYENFKLHISKADSSCSQFYSIGNNIQEITSPDYILNNGTLGSQCIWVAQLSADKGILGVVFTSLVFDNVLDIVAVNDGGTANAPSLYQVTASNINNSLAQEIRSSGKLLWIAFKPVSFSSKIKANITKHDQGGNFKGSGQISMGPTDGNDTVFMLEVASNESVMLNFISSNFAYPAALNIYDGFDTKNLITTLHGKIWYPVVSPSSRMMIIATAFNSGSFKANFSGITPGCLHMSSMSNDNYILSENCNKTCMWVIPPQSIPGSVMLLDLQYISLEKGDILEIYRLDDPTTPVGSLDFAVSHLPQLVFPVRTGALVNITRKSCSEPEKIALVGHSSFIPNCGGVLELNPGETFHLTSPLYPDTYPLLTNCEWVLHSPVNSIIHVAFDKLSLAPNHCLDVFNTRTNVSTEFSTSDLPEDLFLSNGSTIEFISSKCKASKEALQLVSSGGFMLNGTVAECGSVFDQQSGGEFTVNVTSLKQSMCMWKVGVPLTTDDAKAAVNIITYTITTKDNKGNCEFKVYDGASVRDTEILNMTSTSEIWSRTNNLIFFYRRPNVSQPSSVFHVKYSVMTCNSSMLCDNNVCMHPDWKCNGINDCGDFTDEKNCAAVPIPPEIKQSGYSSSAFWGTVISMLFLGALLGVIVPLVYSKYRNGQYRRFGDISVIE